MTRSRTAVANPHWDAAGRFAMSCRRHRLRFVALLSRQLLSRCVVWAKRLSMDMGFNPKHAVLAKFELSQAGYSDVVAYQFQRQLLDRVSQLPGVKAATYATSTLYHGPLAFWSESRSIGTNPCISQIVPTLPAFIYSLVSKMDRTITPISWRGLLSDSARAGAWQCSDRCRRCDGKSTSGWNACCDYCRAIHTAAQSHSDPQTFCRH
jgi:hypothetical protein